MKWPFLALALILSGPAQAQTVAPIAVIIGDAAMDEDPAIYGTLIQKLDAAGYNVQFADLPWQGDLTYWRQVAQSSPNWMAAYTQQIFPASAVGQLTLHTSAPVVLVGTSRAAWCAWWLAAAYPQFKYVIAFSPVIDISILTEFAGFTNPLGNALNPYGLAAQLGQRSIFIEAGIDDQRVGTVPDAAIASFIGRSNASADLTVKLRPPAVHQAPPEAFDDTMAWLAQRVH